MSQNIPLEQQLHEMLIAADYDKLAQYTPESSWATMTSRERDLLGLLFVAHGATQLIDGDINAIKSFDLASQVAPQNAMVCYRQAVAYSIQGNNIQCIIAACKCLQRAIEIEPEFFEAWSLWGVFLLRRGVYLQETIYLDEADQKFGEAISHSKTTGKPKLADLFGHWALCWHQHGKLSGEACDFHRALEKYRRASEYGLNHEEFWNDYGEASLELACLIGRKDLILEAIEHHRKAIQLASDNFRAWMSVAYCFQRLHESTREEKYFYIAHETYGQAAELDQTSMSLWLNWGVLLAEVGKERQDIELLNMSFEKFTKANACEPNNPVVLSHWGEAQGLCGTYCDRVDLLRDAESKIVKSLEIDSECADTWYIYGACLSEMGRYFGDASYYLQAIEKLQYGSRLDPNHPMMLHTLSLAHFAIGELNNDPSMVSKSLEFFSRIMGCTHGRVPPEFWNDWGVALMKLAEMTDDQSCIESAIEKFERAIGVNAAEDPQSVVEPEWMYNYGCAFDFLGDYTEDPRDHEKAIQILTQLAEEQPSETHIRYNLALALSHLGELIDDTHCFQRANDLFQTILLEDSEDGAAWNDWGLTLINYAELVHDSIYPEKSQEIYEQAESKFQHAIALGLTQAFYNLACLYSIMKNYTGAIHYLERSESANALPPIDDILHDAWLDGLRQTPHFRHFLSQITPKDLLE